MSIASVTLFPQEVLALQLEQATAAKFASGTLTISNNNENLAIAFKIEQKAPDTKSSLAVYPQSGRIAPGESMLVTIRCQLSKDDKKIRVKDDLTVRSVLIPSNRHNLKLYDVWTSPEVNKRRGTVSESNFLVVFDEDLDDLGSRLRQTIPSEVAAENYRRSVFHQRMPVGFHPEHFITFQRPLTRPIPRSLVITNHNSYATAFSLRTKTPEFYFTHPKFGRVEPGQNIHITIESRPLPIEPPLNEYCQHTFLVDTAAISPDQEHLSVDHILKFAKQSGRRDFYSHRLHVAYVPAEGLTREELSEYAAGMAPRIPAELISIYPDRALCFQRPVNDSSNFKGRLAVTNIDPGPIAFRLKITAPEMYSVDPVSGTIESGRCLRIKVQRHQMKMEPPTNKELQDVLCIESTRLRDDPNRGNMNSQEIWAIVEKEKREIFRRKLPVSFTHLGGLTPEQQVFKQHQEQCVDAQETSIHKWLLSVVPGY